MIIQYIHKKIKAFYVRNLPIPRLSPLQIKILKEYSLYYHRLNSKQKKKFEKRVQRFIQLKSFHARGGLQEVSMEMKTLIAASAIQLVFGYPNVYFTHFNTILIYPDNYLSTITNKMHQGEVNMQGIIVLSWKNFLRGIGNRIDGLNLGLHEMAHAIKLENLIKNREHNFIPEIYLQEFEVIAVGEIRKLKNNQLSIFREYGSNNTHEFFAVVIEHFFEKPKELFTYNQQLYDLIIKILNQPHLRG